MFGFFEADDADAARALLAAVEAWAKARGRARVRGPINPSLNESAGLLVDGFDTDPMLLMPHNPPEYAAHIESAGYAKVKDLFAWLYDLQGDPPPVIAKLAQRLRERERIVVRPLNLKEFTREVERLRAIYCAAWERNWGFVAPTEAEFRRLATELKPIFDPRCAVCAEVDGRPVACAVAVPDINQALKGHQRPAVPARPDPAAAAQALHHAGAAAAARRRRAAIARSACIPCCSSSSTGRCRRTPYRRAEFSWVLEDNRDINQPGGAGGRHALQDLPHLREGAVSRRIAVTGASGFIGRHVVAHLAARGDRSSRCAVRSSPPRCWRRCAEPTRSCTSRASCRRCASRSTSPRTSTARARWPPRRGPPASR